MTIHNAGNRDIKSELNRMAPAAEHAKLGDVLTDLIATVNTMAAAMDATGAFVNASGTITIGGSITAADSLSLTFTNTLIAALPVTVGPLVVGGGDTTTTIATKLTALVNGSAPLVGGAIGATSTAAVMHVLQPGVVANSTVISATKSGGATETITLSNSGTMSGGMGTFGNNNVAALTVTPLTQR